MTIPEDFMLPLLQDIETTTVEIHKEFARLADKDVEMVYEKLANYYKSLAAKKEIAEPSHPIERCEALMDEILNIIDAREEADLDEHIVNDPNCNIGGQPIRSLHQFYAVAFKRSQKSARYWRKENGARGYLTYIAGFLS